MFSTSVFAVSLIFVCGTAVSSQSETPRPDPANFRSDNCTLFPDGNYRDCCVAHDKDYYFGGTRKERRKSDLRLYRCVRAKKALYNKLVAPVMWVGVRVGGVSWLPTPFRWGFGKTRKLKPIQPAKPTCKRPKR